MIPRLSQKEVNDFSTVATIGQQNTVIQNVNFSEVGGQLQPLWLDYAQDANLIMYVHFILENLYSFMILYCGVRL